MTISSTDVLKLLEGWTLDTTNPTDYDVLNTTMTQYITDAQTQVAAYLGYKSTSSLPTDSVIDMAVKNWTAGMLWQWKYTVDTPNADILEYGVILIERAKDYLNPYLKDSNIDNDGDGRADGNGIITSISLSDRS